MQIHFCEKGFTRLSKGSMAQKVKIPCLRLYNSYTSRFIKGNLFLTFKRKWVLLLAFQVQFLIQTGDSGSNPERAHGHKFLCL